MWIFYNKIARYNKVPLFCHLSTLECLPHIAWCIPLTASCIGSNSGGPALLPPQVVLICLSAPLWNPSLKLRLQHQWKGSLGSYGCSLLELHYRKLMCPLTSWKNREFKKKIPHSQDSNGVHLFDWQVLFMFLYNTMVGMERKGGKLAVLIILKFRNKVVPTSLFHFVSTKEELHTCKLLPWAHSQDIFSHYLSCQVCKIIRTCVITRNYTRRVVARGTESEIQTLLIIFSVRS